MNTSEQISKLLSKYGIPPAQKLVKYIELVFEWNEKINITGSKNYEDFVLKHVLDSILAYRVKKAETSHRILDVGSGGGLPGIVFSIISPNTEVVLIEKKLKKANVLKSIIEALGLTDRVSVFCGGFEDFNNVSDSDEIWFRGFLPANKLIKYFNDNFEASKFKNIILMKGPSWGVEKSEAINLVGISDEWVMRFVESVEIDYELPDGTGSRRLVLI